MSNLNLIECISLKKYYQKGQVIVKALDGADVCVTRGEYVAVLGPSGSGKSTLMNLLGCLDSPSSGEYWLNQRNVSRLSRNELAVIRNRSIGFVFQSFNLLGYVSALDNVALPLLYRGDKLSVRRQKAKSMLEQVGLADRLDHMPTELSGGQCQRVAIARALVTDPDLILADEPTGNLDTASGQEVVRLFERLVENGKTVIIVTHDTSLAKRMQRIISLRDGKIIEDVRSERW